MLDEDLPLGCQYCDKRFPSQRSLSQHERGAHQPQVSEREARQAGPSSRYWSAEEEERFLEGVKRHGISSNAKIAGVVGTRTAQQVRAHKTTFLRKAPEWKGYVPPGPVAEEPTASPEPSNPPAAEHTTPPVVRVVQHSRHTGCTGEPGLHGQQRVGTIPGGQPSSLLPSGRPCSWWYWIPSW